MLGLALLHGVAFSPVTRWVHRVPARHRVTDACASDGGSGSSADSSGVGDGGSSGSCGGDGTGDRLRGGWQDALASVRDFRWPSLEEDELPEAVALAAQLELLAVKFAGVKSVRRLEDFETTPSNEDFALLTARAGAYLTACARRVVEAPAVADRQPAASGSEEAPTQPVAGAGAPPPPPPAVGARPQIGGDVEEQVG